MGELTVSTFVTLDGVMQAPGGPTEDTSGGFTHGGWVAPHFDDDMGSIIDAIFANADAFLLGRTTYDIFAAYWPRITDPDNIVATSLNSLPKFVASRTRTSFDWSNTSHVRDVVQEVRALKQRFPREIQIHGSCGLLQTLIANDLIDEYRLFTFPVLIGTGKRLFGAGTVPAGLSLVQSRPTASGVLYSVYRRAGPLVTGEA
ncbi:MAG TPA: dihydrofolate reductase family protein [Chloroflexi bacterium]|jgi:dihydrofolate reductase|nr:dihydrofolate reductase family protein [Chloroflexota bacterium]